MQSRALGGVAAAIAGVDGMKALTITFILIAAAFVLSYQRQFRRERARS